MTDFKVGDRVVWDKNQYQSGIKHQGLTGTVVSTSPCDVGVEWDKYIVGHNCNNKGKQGYCWYMDRKIISIIKEKRKNGVIYKGELISLFKDSIREEEDYDE